MLFKRLTLGKLRVLLDGGGKQIVDGIAKKIPCRWADFRERDSVEVTDEADIKTMKRASGYGKEFVMVPPRNREKEKKVENPLKKKVALVED